MKKFYIVIVLAIPILASCGKKQGPEGKKSLLDLISEAPGPNCSTGGYKIVSGIDINNDNVLDADEIQSTKYICNGLNGSNHLLLLPSCARCIAVINQAVCQQLSGILTVL